MIQSEHNPDNQRHITAHDEEKVKKNDNDGGNDNGDKEKFSPGEPDNYDADKFSTD